MRGGWEVSGRLGCRAALNRARGSRSDKFAAQDGAKARAAKKLVPWHFRAPTGESRGLFRAANRRLICHARILLRLLEMLLGARDPEIGKQY
jgi:hypothetical protein